MHVILLSFFLGQSVYRSELVQMASISELAESIKTFNINYKDTGLFGVYAMAKVSKILRSYK